MLVRDGAAEGEVGAAVAAADVRDQYDRQDGENLAQTFMNDFPQPGALPIMVYGQVVGAMGFPARRARSAQAAIDAVFRQAPSTAAR